MVWKHTRALASPPDEIILNCWAVWDDDAFDPQHISDLEIPFFIDHGRVMLDDNVNRATGFRGVDEDCYDLVDKWLGKSEEMLKKLVSENQGTATEKGHLGNVPKFCKEFKPCCCGDVSR